MNAPEVLHALGQSLWIDNITSELLISGTLQDDICDFTVTEPTSNPAIFDHAIGETNEYDSAIDETSAAGKSCKNLFFELAQQDLTKATDLFHPAYDATEVVDGADAENLLTLLSQASIDVIALAAQLQSGGVVSFGKSWNDLMSVIAGKKQAWKINSAAVRDDA